MGVVVVFVVVVVVVVVVTVVVVVVVLLLLLWLLLSLLLLLLLLLLLTQLYSTRRTAFPPTLRFQSHSCVRWLSRRTALQWMVARWPVAGAPRVCKTLHVFR